MNKRIEFHSCGIVLTWWKRHQHFLNKHFDNELWFIEEESNLRIGFSRPLFEKVDVRYDGHTVKGITLFGISVTIGYTYDSRPVKPSRSNSRR